MEILKTGDKARCQQCHEIVDRGIRTSDSAIVSMCPACGILQVEGVQTVPHKLTNAEIDHLSKTNGCELIYDFDADLKRLESIKQVSGLSWGRLSMAAGEHSNYFCHVRNRLKTRSGFDRQRFLRAVELIERALEQGKPLVNGNGEPIDLTAESKSEETTLQPMIVDYDVAIGDCIEECVLNVRHYIQNGWQPYGGLQIDSLLYIQPMIKIREQSGRGMK
ncbi:hypothetical protein D6779_11360 [Candidatus Parcubacteria bacterium]|nr:MAG: hypothetical protein D6779_11360 [Candidatus Parcubacteria bacterium]